MTFVRFITVWTERYRKLVIIIVFISFYKKEWISTAQFTIGGGFPNLDTCMSMSCCSIWCLKCLSLRQMKTDCFTWSVTSLTSCPPTAAASLRVAMTSNNFLRQSPNLLSWTNSSNIIGWCYEYIRYLICISAEILSLTSFSVTDIATVKQL